MRLNDLERAMLAGEHGQAAKNALEHQVRVGEFFGAADLVPVTQAHIMADTESLGEAGLRWLESLARDDPQARVRVPTIMDPRGTDFAKASVLKQPGWAVALERRAVAAFSRLGILMTDTCINYQTIQAPARGESVAFGDTGVVIYSNSVCGARSNFEGGPSALAAALTARTPRYGFHLQQCRQATLRVRVAFEPESLNDWGALGAVVGRLAGNYWAVPYVEGLERVRFLRAPTIIAAISRVREGIPIPEWEQILSAGAACQTLCIAAHAMGFVANWITEWPAYHPQVREALGLKSGERIAGFIYIGHPAATLEDRPRPAFDAIATRWTSRRWCRSRWPRSWRTPTTR